MWSKFQSRQVDEMTKQIVDTFDDAVMDDPSTRGRRLEGITKWIPEDWKEGL